MGAYLSAPITDKATLEKNEGNLAYGMASMQGWRKTMEDRHSESISLLKKKT
jgi:hypothetical protein